MVPLDHDPASVGRWKHEHAALERRLETARSFHGLTASGAPVGHAQHLRRGERLFLVVERAALIEPKGLPVDSAEPLDRGTVTITDRRVVFDGAHRTREWRFAKLVDHRHYDRRPATMLEVTNRARVSGIAYGDDHAADVRFLFDLALAHHDGTVSAFQQEIARQIVRHDARRPAVHAGAWVWRGWARPVPVASALLTAVVVAAALLAGPGRDATTDARALHARGAASASAVADVADGLDSDGDRVPAVAAPPIPAAAVTARGDGAARSRPASSTPAPACATVLLVGPLTVPDPLCTIGA